jgi:type IV pilus assembly protein PilF
MKRLQRFPLIVLLAVMTGCATTGNSDSRRGGKTDYLRAAKANTQLGIEYLRDSNYEMSRIKLEKALSLAPDYAGAHEAIAVLYGRVGENALADKHYRRALELDPESAQNHNNYGQFLCAQKRYQEAEKEFMVAANNPFYAVPSLPLTNAGMCAELIPDPEKAENLYRQALERDPNFAPALLQMGNLSYENGNYISARGYLQRYQQVAEHNPESLWLAIRTEYAMGNHAAWGNFAVILRNKFPDSEQADRLRRWENEHVSGQ